MKEAVYPPEQFAGSPGREREWLRPAWGVFTTVDGEVVSYTGIVLTEADVNGQRTPVGGVGGIATHPSHRGRGHAARSIALAVDWMTERDARFALLVCRGELVSYYEALGWELFDGELLVTQFGKPETFAFNDVMVVAAAGQPPAGGTVDLHGPPW